MEVEADRVVTHLFTCLSPAYVGWRWAVTVSRASRAKAVTVSENVLLPGPDALLAPDWVPWTERVRPGDLKAGDLMPAGSDDERLVPVVAIVGEAGLLDWDENDAWRLGVGAGEVEAGEASQPGVVDGPQPGEPDAAQAQRNQAEPGQAEPGQAEPDQADPDEAEPDQGQPDQGQPVRARTAQPQAGRPAARTDAGGQGRGRRRPRSGQSRARSESVGMLRPTRMLSATGRDDAAGRWYAGEQGPRSALASAAPANCMTCGFMIRISGPLGRVFGVCANEYAPDDGKVVSVDHGCGAHSEGEAGAIAPAADTVIPAVDEVGYDMLTSGATLPESVLETLDHELL
jgi:hypothetical protein